MAYVDTFIGATCYSPCVYLVIFTTEFCLHGKRVCFINVSYLTFFVS